MVSDRAVAPPLLDTSPDGFRAALEADSIGARVLATELPTEAHLDADATWSVGGPNDPFRNMVASARFDEATADRRIAQIVAAYDAVPTPHLWWRAPVHTPSDLGDRLERAHVYPVGEAPAMAVDLDRLVIPSRSPAGVEIRGVTDEAGLRAYIDVLASEPPPRGAPPIFPPDVAERLIAYAAPRLAGEPVPFRWVAWLGDRPVATAKLSLAGGTAGIYSVDTLPEARGRGIGTAITVAPLLAARGIGYRIGTLQSSDMGYGVYRKLGFEELFRYTIHVHLPGGARLAG